jgi:hypothetical protein
MPIMRVNHVLPLRGYLACRGPESQLLVGPTKSLHMRSYLMRGKNNWLVQLNALERRAWNKYGQGTAQNIFHRVQDLDCNIWI